VSEPENSWPQLQFVSDNQGLFRPHKNVPRINCSVAHKGTRVYKDATRPVERNFAHF
jgi:hypothetical protein